MNATLAEFLSPLAAVLPDALAPAAAHTALREAAARLPFAAGTHVLFEVRLGREAGGIVDFSVNLALGDPRARAEFATHPATRDVCALASVLDARPAAGALPPVWLECDSTTAGESPPLPGMFVQVRERTRAEISHLLQAARNSPGSGLDAACWHSVESALAARPRETALIYVGFMAGRVPPAVRLELSPPTPAAIPSTCRALGWPGDFRALARAQQISAAAERVFLALDVVDSVQPRLGLELHTGGVFRPRRDSMLWRLLDAFVDAGLADETQRVALLGWPGVGAVDLPGATEPSVCFRTVNHLKLVLAADGTLAAKAYLLCRVRPAAELAQACARRSG